MDSDFDDDELIELDAVESGSSRPTSSIPRSSEGHIETVDLSLDSDGDIEDCELLDMVDEIEKIKNKTSLNSGKLVQTTLSGQKIQNFSPPNASGGTFRPPVVDNTPTHHELDHGKLGSYIYPSNLPVRDYQRTIVHSALFRNVLCALPTGLGKTFIASAVMLNWYRWTKSSKVVFMAPTRPLVSQQIEACLGITGMPRSDSSVLIGGSLKPEKRQEEWDSKRIFFATPQTVDNDLKKGILDPKSIACLVIDEAHRATGRHAYVEVVNFISRFNNSFRILALTATPSGRVEGVQEVVTNLKISKVEIRTEESIDIRQYVHTRKIERIITEHSHEQREVLELFCQSFESLLQDMNTMKVYYVSEPSSISQFGVLQALQKFNLTPVARTPVAFKVRAVMSLLIKVAHALHLLKIHGLKPFHDYVKVIHDEAMSDGKDKKKKPGKIVGQIINHEGFVECMKLCERILFLPNGRLNDKVLGHVKLEKILEILNEFFETKDNVADSRVMIFAEYRESAAEIVRVLQNNCPRVKAHTFIGQANTGAGRKKNKNKKDDNNYYNDEFDNGVEDSSAKAGMSQKEQQIVVAKFKQGEINVLVATSIGEEGLDIGEVDLIICYDQSKSPIRGLQRMGRTGRKRQGKIYMLMDRSEERKLDMALDGYRYIQKLINQGGFDCRPVDRMLPEEVKPSCEFKEIDIPEDNKEVLNAEDIVVELGSSQKKKSSKKRKNTASGGSKKTKIQKKFNMPDNVQTGFVSAKNIVYEEDDWGPETNTSKAPANQTRAGRSANSILQKEDIVKVPKNNEGFLTAEEKEILQQRYARVSGRDIAIEHKEYDPLIGVRRKSSSVFVPHGRKTHRFIDTIQKIRKGISDDDIRVLRKNLVNDNSVKKENVDSRIVTKESDSTLYDLFNSDNDEFS